MINNIYGTAKNYVEILGWRGFLYAIKAKTSKSNTLFEINENEISFPFHLRMGTSDVPTFRQVYQDKEYSFIAKTAPEVIIDAGANIGLTSIYFANKYPNAKIIAIEPEIGNFELLSKNTSPYPNIIPLNAALWGWEEELSLVDPGEGNWGFRIDEATEGARPVTAFTVDSIIKEFKLDKIDILKIDIEGAEKEVFENSLSWIDNVGTIIVELHERFKPGCSRSFYNGSNGFDVEWLQGELVYLTRNDNIMKDNIAI